MNKSRYVRPSDFDIDVFIILQNGLAKLDRLLDDTKMTIDEIGYQTKNINRYRYIIEPC